MSPPIILLPNSAASLLAFEPPEWACATHIALFAGLSEFETDLKQHVHLENDVLFPRAIETGS